MAGPHTITWQRRRSEFNHDWLKNRYLLALGTWLNILAGEVADQELETIFVPQMLPEWAAHRDELFNLIGAFENGMSPRILFERSPLRDCDSATKQWLSEVLHILWLDRRPVRVWVTGANEAAQVADDSYRHLVGLLTPFDAAPEALDLRGLEPAFLHFYTSCQDLTERISLFPPRIELA